MIGRLRRAYVGVVPMSARAPLRTQMLSGSLIRHGDITGPVVGAAVCLDGLVYCLVFPPAPTIEGAPA